MKLAFREYGSGQPLVILHGLFGQNDNWNTLSKLFAEHGFHVYGIDQRNHGHSPHSDEWDYEVMADDLKEFIDEHKLVKPIILGHSMGGKTVLFFEWKYPQIASKIVIADMSALAYDAHHHNVLKALNAVDFSIVRNRKEAEARLSEYIKDFGTKQFLLKNLHWKDDENTEMDWRFNLKIINEKYDNIRVAVPAFVSDTPCLVINGARSKYVDDEAREDFRKRFTNCLFETVEDAGHWLHAEQPEEFMEQVLGFIKD
jgi:esterase